MGVGSQPGAGVTELSRLKGRGGARRGGASRDLEGTLEGGMGRRALNQEASQSLAGTAGEGNWDASGGACEERSRGARWEERECERERVGSFSAVPRFSSLLHQAAGDVVQHLLVCSCPDLPSPLSEPPAYLETMHITVQHLV